MLRYFLADQFTFIVQVVDSSLSQLSSYFEALGGVDLGLKESLVEIDEGLVFHLGVASIAGPVLL